VVKNMCVVVASRMVLNVEGIQKGPIEIGSQLCDFGWIIMAWMLMLHVACCMLLYWMEGEGNDHWREQ